MYDIIGDVHGYASLLKKLLLQIGYVKTESGYSHPSRKAIFVGDFVNRGPEIRKTIRIVRKMVENGNALAIIGNHEINAIIYYLKDKDGLPLIKSPGKNFLALYKTINQFSDFAEEWKSHRKWMSELPLYLDLGEIRVVHACWSESSIELINYAEREGKSRNNIFRKVYKKPKSPLGKSVLKLTKGIDFKMPGDLKIINNKGVSPQSFRMRWWEDPAGKSFEEMSFDSKFALPQYEIPKQIMPRNIPYPENAPIVFFGHYCRHEGPHIIKPNLCCVDSCVAGTKTLTAYLWNGEKVLDPSNLVYV
jgi:hypothetical protein